MTTRGVLAALAVIAAFIVAGCAGALLSYEPPAEVRAVSSARPTPSDMMCT